MGRRQTIHIPGVAHNAPIPFGARVGNIVYSSGIQGINADNGELSEDVAEQARQCFRNLRTFLEHAGATTDDVVRLTCYLQDFGDRPTSTRRGSRCSRTRTTARRGTPASTTRPPAA